ncbi:IS1595 family transposase [Candidatus Uhrbacteria bacterium]|nr:IS1595 family transposase [Candidatus Uhrbacteria bacterium]
MTNPVICPHCGSDEFWAVRGHALKCSACRVERVAIPARPVTGFALTRRGWLSAIDCLLRDGTGTAMALELGMAERTAYKVIAALQRAMCGDAPVRLRGAREADATYVGGDWANKRVHIRAKGTKRGRGTSKRCVFGVVQRRGPVIVWAVPGERREVVGPLIAAAVEPGATVCTDECGAYGHLAELGFGHETVNHGAGEYARGDVHTQTLDGYWGRLKNFLAAKGGVQPQHLMRFVGEHSWRYNNRGLSRKEQALKLYGLLVQK